MGFNLLWFEDEDIKAAEEEFSRKLASNLESALESKQKQIKWKNNIDELGRRFHNTFGLAGLHIAEIAFTSMSAEYRTVCVVIPEEKAVVYYTTIPKKGSFQKRQFEIIRENAEEIKRFIQKKADQLSS